MRLEGPRLAPLDEAAWSDEQRELLAGFRRNGKLLNIFGTLAHHPKLLKRWSVFGSHLLAKSSLPPRDRELVILRTAWRCGGEYEWGQHLRIGREAGLKDDDFDRIAAAPQATDASAHDALLLAAVDELIAHHFLSTPNWERLTASYRTEQVLDLIFTVGQYSMLAMALNSLGVELEDGVVGFSKDHAPTVELDLGRRR